MSTRYKTNSRVHQDQSPLPTGYEKGSGLPDLTIPPCGIEDVDVSLFKLFDKEISPQCGGISGSPMAKVPVIFAAGEKWALLKRSRPLRDRNGTLILPLITIMRSEMNQTASEDVVGRGINQQIGEIVVRRKLDKSDRSYQALINRNLLLNQRGLAVRPHDVTDPKQPIVDRRVGDRADSTLAGNLLEPDVLNNVYETVVVPTPQFYTAKYQVTVWTQYTQHANQVMEKIFMSFLPQGQCWRLETDKGYWFIAKFEDGSLTMETNFEDMSAQERFIKHAFNVSVPAYFFASASPGAPIPIKRYVSSPIISFETEAKDSTELSSSQEQSEWTLGSDDPTLPLDEQKNNRQDQRSPGWRQQKIYPAEDPALSTLPRGRAPKIISRTSRGETVYKDVEIGGLSIVVSKI